jgi:hypothetical protein
MLIWLEKVNLLFEKMVMTPITSKIHVIFSKCDNENIQIHISLLLGLKFCTEVKNKYGKGIFDHFFFFAIKVIRFWFLHKSFIVPKIKAFVLQFCSITWSPNVKGSFLCFQSTQNYFLYSKFYKHQHVCFKLNMRIRKKIRNEDVHIYKMHKWYKKNPK